MVRPSHSTRPHHALASGLAVAACAAALTASPALADPPAPAPLSPADVRVWEAQQPTSAPGSVARPGPAALTTDENTIELLQVALGALGGAAVIVVGLTAARSARARGAHTPA